MQRAPTRLWRKGAPVALGIVLVHEGLVVVILKVQRALVQRPPLQAHGGGGSATGGGTQEVIKLAGSNILLHAVNELDADADFAAVYAADTCADGTLALRRHLTVRDLLLVLADCGEDLVLEYTLAGI